MYIKSFPFRGSRRAYNVYNDKDEYLETFRLLREAEKFIKENRDLPCKTVAPGLATIDPQ